MHQPFRVGLYARSCYRWHAVEAAAPFELLTIGRPTLAAQRLIMPSRNVDYYNARSCYRWHAVEAAAPFELLTIGRPTASPA
jgi:hypothetical protein